VVEKRGKRRGPKKQEKLLLESRNKNRKRHDCGKEKTHWKKFRKQRRSALTHAYPPKRRRRVGTGNRGI